MIDPVATGLAGLTVGACVGAIGCFWRALNGPSQRARIRSLEASVRDADAEAARRQRLLNVATDKLAAIKEAAEWPPV